LTKCCKCGRKNESTEIGRNKHIICFDCLDDWQNFAHKNIVHLHNGDKKNHHKIWETLFQQFLGNNKEVVQFT